MPTILLKKSDTASAVPSTANLTNLAGGAEVAVNTADRRMFTMNSSSAVVELGTNPTTLSTASLTVTTGNAAFTGTAQRITGDFSNATPANRLAFQSSTTNGNTQVNLIPNGTATDARLFAYTNSADLSNSSFAAFGVSTSEVRITSGISGSGTYLPITILNGGGEAARVTTTRNLLVGTSTDLSGRSGAISDAIGNVRDIPSAGSAKTSNYTLAISDIGEFVTIGASGSITVPNDIFAAGNAVSIYNNTASNATISLTITTAYISGTDTDKASVTLATRGVTTILFVDPSLCVLTGSVS
jgi:hypothetical protein